MKAYNGKGNTEKCTDSNKMMKSRCGGIENLKLKEIKSCYKLTINMFKWNKLKNKEWII